jgi:hypothetical protein
MSVPTTRTQFKANILRRIGAPVIEINVDDDQVDDRIDEALSYWHDFHYDGQTKQYYKYGPITSTDQANKYITLPANIIGAVSIFPVGQSLSTNNLFNIRYQIALNDLYDLTATTMVPYYMAMQHIQFLEQLLVGNQPIRFERHSNRCYIDMDWTKVNVGEYLIIEAYGVVDPTVYADVWSDRWLQRYASALVKQQWAENLSKYTEVSLPGGTKFNAQNIMQTALAEKEKLEEEIRTTYSLPPAIFMG